MFDSSQTPCQGILHSSIPSAAGAIPVHVRTGRLVARGEDEWEHDTNADVCKKAVNHELFLTSGSSTEFNGWTAKTTQQISELQFDKFPTPSSFLYLERDKIQKPGEFLFLFSIGSYLVDQRSGDGRFCG